MKAITLWEPWASLVAQGHKKIETRSWKAPDEIIGQRIAIHAAKTMPGHVKPLCRKFAELLGIEKYNGSWLYYLEHGTGNFGKVIATCRLVDCVKIIDNIHGEYALLQNTAGTDGNAAVEGNEYAFGDYTVGRWAWILEDVIPLQEPVAAKGRQKFWSWDR